VSGTGSKITTYNISCKDFSKAIRATEIYHNPHLSHQTEEKKKGVVRKDVRANLGGIALLNKGIAVEGTPRQIILQNLMRLLGFGGQWALPFSYRESLPKSAITIFDKKEKGKQSFANDLQGAKYAVINSPDETVKKEFIKLLEDLALEAVSVDKPVSQLWKDAIEVPSESATLLHKRVKALANKFRYSNFEFQTPEAAKSGKLAFINNTFFKIQGVSKDKLSKGMGASNPDVIVSEKEQGLKEDLEKVTKRVLKEVQSYDNNVVNEFGAFPRANLFAEGAALSQVEAFKTDVGTIFNILCLDYLEPVGGYWPSADNIFYQGSLYSSLERAANRSMNELFFDLRPSPLFKPERHDGTGMPLNGAIPMVPAVVLRQKPFTNYPVPNKELTNKDINGSLVTGGFKDKKGAFSDQLVVNSGGALGAYGGQPVAPSSAEGKKVVGQLKALDDNKGVTPASSTTSLKTVSNPESKLGWAARLASLDLATTVKETVSALVSTVKNSIEETTREQKYKEELSNLSEKIAKGEKVSNQDIVTMYDKSVVAPVDGPASTETKEVISLGKKDSSLVVSRKTVSSVVTLPRPIFRSPDNNRITKELIISETQYILGTQEVNKETGKLDNTFSAFSTNQKNVGIDTKGITGSTSFVDSSGKKVDKSTNPLALLADGTNMYDINNRLSEANSHRGLGKNIDDYTYHVFDYCTVNDIDCISESYSRGDYAVKNFIEYWGSIPGDRSAQRLFLGTVMPIITPISVYRFGIRVQESSTEHVQALLPGETNLSRQKNTLLSWVVLQDMWVQHNHEYLSGRMSLRGLPGIRPGYRVDRPQLNLSFYVEGVQHSWQHPGALSTNLTVSRGQPSGEENALKYHTPQPKEDPAATDRQELGRVFSTSKFKKGGRNFEIKVPGTYTGSATVGAQIPPKTRDKLPKTGDEKKTKK
jgi:uncharacterized FlaG/YvyC family protein